MSAAEDNEERLADMLQLKRLEEEAEDTGIGRYGSVLSGVHMEGFLHELLDDAAKAVVSEELLRDLGAVLVTVLLCGAVKAAAIPTGNRFDAVSAAGAAAVTLLLAGGQESLVDRLEQAVFRLRDVANVLLPMLGTTAFLSGQVTAAAAKYAAAAWFFNVLVNLSSTFVLPTVRIYVAAAAAEAAVGGSVLGGVLGFLKWCVTAALTCLLLAFTLFLSLSSLTGNAADAAAVRSAKTAISAMLPVVGGIAGDAASALLAAASVIRQSVGIFGLLTVTGVLLLPFLQAGARYLLLKGAAAVSAGLTDERLSGLLRRMGEASAMLLGCLGTCALLLFFTVYSFMGAASL